MTISRLLHILIMAVTLSFPILIYAEDPSVNGIPGFESVTEAEIKGLGLLKVGGKVSHTKFGIGTVKSISLGNATTVNIIFETHGSKWLLAEYANLILLNE